MFSKAFFLGVVEIWIVYSITWICNKVFFAFGRINYCANEIFYCRIRFIITLFFPGLSSFKYWHQGGGKTVSDMFDQLVWTDRYLPNIMHITVYSNFRD